MRKWLFSTVAVLLILSMVWWLVGPPRHPPPGCPKEPRRPKHPHQFEGVLRVGMVSDVGGVDDASFNQNTWEGLAGQDELGFRPVHREPGPGGL